VIRASGALAVHKVSWFDTGSVFDVVKRYIGKDGKALWAPGKKPAPW
jgi:hypothetical protein